MSKICIKCNIPKELSEFYKHSKMLDGHLNKCKTCTKLVSNSRRNSLRNDKTWMESEKIRTREKYHRLNYRNKHKQSKEDRQIIQKNYRSKFPEKCYAQSCASDINNHGYHRHHWSYKPEHVKDIILLDIENHNNIHIYTIYDMEHYQYRTISGILLDTKAKYIEYMNQYNIIQPKL